MFFGGFRNLHKLIRSELVEGGIGVIAVDDTARFERWEGRKQVEAGAKKEGIERDWRTGGGESGDD